MNAIKEVKQALKSMQEGKVQQFIKKGLEINMFSPEHKEIFINILEDETY